MNDQQEMSPMAAVRKFFAETEKPVSMDELKALSAEDRKELGQMAAAELGVKLKMG